MTIRAVIYTRVSTGTQAEEGVSLDAQRDMAERYCRERGWQLVGEYRDVMSGRIDKRPQLRALEVDARNKAFEVVLVYRADRLARSFTKTIAVMAGLAEAGVAFVSMTEPLDVTTPLGKAFLGILAGMAEQESDNIGQRVRDAKRYGASRGVWQSNRVPLGYLYAGKGAGGARITIDEDWAPLVRRVFALFDAGGNFHSIARTLNEEGQPTRDGATWNATGVRNMLINPTYSGCVAHGRRPRRNKRQHRAPESAWTVSDATFPAIIDPETWQRTRARLGEVASLSPRDVYARATHPWSGLVVCGACGFRMVYNENRGNPNYLCRSASQLCAVRPSIPQRVLEEEVLPRLFRTLRRYARIGLGAVVQPAARPDPSRRVKALEARIARAKRLALAGVLDEDEAAREVSSARAELAELTAAPPAAPAVPVFDPDLADYWPHLTAAERGSFLRDWLARVSVTWETATVELQPFGVAGFPRSMRVRIPRKGRVRQLRVTR